MTDMTGWAYKGFARKLSRLSWRQRLAYRLDRLFPRSCWPDWWEWGEGDQGDRTMRDIVRGNQFCTISEQTGSCWCGKKQASPSTRSTD